MRSILNLNFLIIGILMGCSQGMMKEDYNVSGMTAEEVFHNNINLAKILKKSCKGNFSISDFKEGNYDILNETGFQGTTPLMWVVSCKNSEAIKKFLELGADPNKVNEDVSPLIISICNQDIETVYLLIKNGADPNLPTLKKNIPLRIALEVSIAKNDQRPMEILLENGADPFGKQEGFRPVIETAANVSSFKEVKLMMPYVKGEANIKKIIDIIKDSLKIGTLTPEAESEAKDIIANYGNYGDSALN